ncbi:Hemoglobin subunit alpha-1 [Merluccius polli]|uniref:Hemoglobin subunit alpha-1 n=1 Tax=Merluccius polli TaxID=89951 RepID=A0AA47P6K7_MERPO|nr:Hemoglobin subunit alpha-1 [Merluccius polli]
MSLTVKQKATIKDFLSKVTSRHEDIGAEALSRMVAVYPQTKSYFAHWTSTDPGSAPVRKHGVTIMNGVYDAISKIDDLKGGLLSLSELHAFMLRVDPVNFKLLSHCMLVSFAMFYPDDFTPVVHVAIDKFLAQVALALCEKFVINRLVKKASCDPGRPLDPVVVVVGERRLWAKLSSLMENMSHPMHDRLLRPRRVRQRQDDLPAVGQQVGGARRDVQVGEVRLGARERRTPKCAAMGTSERVANRQSHQAAAAPPPPPPPPFANAETLAALGGGGWGHCGRMPQQV